jgi:hypothetical protein
VARTQHGKSSLYVVGHDLFERFEIQTDLSERFHYGRSLASLLDSILELLPTVAVLAVDREWARLFMLRQGELQEVSSEENVRLDDGERWDSVVSGTRHVPGAPGSGGAGRGQPGSGPRSDSGTDLFEAREAGNQQRFYNHKVAQLGRVLGLLDIQYLILVGPVKRVAEFRAELPAKAPYEVIRKPIEQGQHLFKPSGLAKLRSRASRKKRWPGKAVSTRRSPSLITEWTETG